MVLVFSIVCILGVLTVTEQKNKPIAQLDDVLEYLASHKSSKNEANIDHYRDRKQRADENIAYDSNANLLQALQLLYKQNNKKNVNQLENYDDNKDYRLEDDRICKSADRCGCGGGRCGGTSNVRDKSINDVSQMLKDLDKELSREEKEAKLQGDNIRDPADVHDLTYKRTENLDDDFDIVFIEAPDSDDNQIVNLLQRLGDNLKVIDLRDIDLNNVLSNRKSYSRYNKKSKRPPGPALTPEDFVSYYEEGKNKISNDLLQFIKGRSDGTILSELLPYQKKQLELLKKQQSSMMDDDIKSQIVKTLFGVRGKSKILPQSQDDNIYIPLRMHDAIKRFNKEKEAQRNDPSRLAKNILPLTLQQKIRKNQKMSPNLISKHSWRRNGHEQPKYGVPFNLDLQGLAQVKE